jgi:hypothetical protein
MTLLITLSKKSTYTAMSQSIHKVSHCVGSGLNQKYTKLQAWAQQGCCWDDPKAILSDFHCLVGKYFVCSCRKSPYLHQMIRIHEKLPTRTLQSEVIKGDA